ncbi:MAG TPA: glycosyltransferase family 4 protein [Patescibacteria group bacterium]|nr:glycosyltransferase family 4 protein [Patescibacteria group bacterium]
MNILFITPFFYPHIGGVEKHVLKVSKELIKKGNKVTVLTRKHEKRIINKQTINGVRIERFYYPQIKFIGLSLVWLQLIKRFRLIFNADVVHIHDVFIWYLPFRFIFFNKKNVTTIHGFEWDNPLSLIGLWQKRLAIKLSNASVGAGEFLEKYLKVKFDLITYGGISMSESIYSKVYDLVVYVGRLEENTGFLEFLKWLDKNKKYHVDFCGDGPLRAECEKYGIVHGFTDPVPFLKKAEICVPGGYLAALEGLAYNCKLKLFWNNKVKEDYWKMSPFYKLKGKELKKWAREQTWDKIADEYMDLYTSK